MSKASTFYNTLTDVLKARLALALAAFQHTRDNRVLPPNPEKTPFAGVVGWLYPNHCDHPARFALRPGIQYLAAGRTPGLSGTQNAHSVATVEVLKDRVELTEKGSDSSRVIYHGERVMVGAQEYRLAMLPARATAQAMKKLFVMFAGALVLYGMQSPVAGAAEIGPFTKSAFQEVNARFREPFTVRESVPGLVRLKSSDAQAQVLIGGTSYEIPVADVHPARTHYLILFDGSTLCAMRGMQGLLDQELRELLATLDPSSRVTLVRYERKSSSKGDNRINYDHVITAGTLVSERRANNRLVQCNRDTYSVNGLAAMAEVSAQVFKDNKETDDNGRPLRRVVLLFSPGNISALPARELMAVKRLGIDYVHTVVFSPVESEMVRSALAALGEFGMTTWWTKPVPLHVNRLLNYAWDFDLEAALPTSVPEGTYTLGLTDRNGKLFLLTFPLRYAMNAHNLFLYRIWTWALAILAVLLLAVFIYRTVRYYRTKRCPHDGMVQSRKWNHCLFCAAATHPILVVERGERNLERAFVLKDPSATVGRRLGDSLRLREVSKQQGLRITRIMSDTYELSLERGHAFVLNGEGRADSIYLKHGDRIDLGAYQIYFLRQPRTEKQ